MSVLLRDGAEAGSRLPEGWSGSSGTFTRDTGTKRSGGFAYKHAAGSSYRQLSYTAVSGRWRWMRFWVYFDNWPSSNQNLAQVMNGLTALTVLNVSSSGQLRTSTPTGSNHQLSLSTWHRIDFGYMGDGANVYADYQVDGVSVFSGSVANANLSDEIRLGVINGPGTIGVCYFDDIGINDDQGATHNSRPSATGRVGYIFPTADQTIGADWRLGDGTAFGAAPDTATNSLDNVPPVGVSDASGSRKNQQIRDAVSNASGAASQADLTMQTYSAWGVPSGSGITLARAVASVADSSGSLTVTAGVEVVSNPAIAEGTGATVAAAASTYTTGWAIITTAWAENPAVTLGTAPVARVSKRQATATALIASSLGIVFEYEEPFELEPTGIASAEAFGTPTVALDDQFVAPSGIASGEAFGTPTVAVSGGTQFVAPTGIASAEAFGTPIVSADDQFVAPDGIESEEAFGFPLLVQHGVGVYPSSIGTAEAFGTPTVANAGATTVAPTGITSREAFGVPRVYRTADPAIATPRNALWNPVTDHTYEWAINHSEEDEITVGRQIDHGAPAATVAVVRQQRPAGSLVLSLSGTILDPAQQAELEDFFDDCDDTTLYYRDSETDTYEVVITSFDSKRVRTARNPVTAGLFYWTYSITMDVVRVLSGPYLAAA